VWIKVPLNMVATQYGPVSRLGVSASGALVLAAGHYHLSAEVPIIRAEKARLRFYSTTLGKPLCHGVTAHSPHVNVPGRIELDCVASLGVGPARAPVEWRVFFFFFFFSPMFFIILSV
jgi:hypothetical protein